MSKKFKFVCLTLMTPLLFACGVRDFTQPTGIDNQGRINVSVKVGESFTLTNEGPVMPYKHELAQSFDTTLLKYLDMKSTPPGSLAAPGAVGSEIWKFQALKEGATEVHIRLLALDGTDQKSDIVYNVSISPLK